MAYHTAHSLYSRMHTNCNLKILILAQGPAKRFGIKSLAVNTAQVVTMRALEHYFLIKLKVLLDGRVFPPYALHSYLFQIWVLNCLLIFTLLHAREATFEQCTLYTAKCSAGSIVRHIPAPRIILFRPEFDA